MLSAPWIQGETFATAFNQLEVPGVRAFDYTQHSECGAIRFHLTGDAAYRPWRTALALLTLLREHYGDEHLFAHSEARPGWMTKLCGTASWQDFFSGLSLANPTQIRTDLI
jgi:uncharacterized protein YbbC (DUF1343 family)